MEILQIWIGDVSSDIKNAMIDIRNFCKKNGIEYVLISDRKIIRGKYTWIDYNLYVKNIVYKKKKWKDIWKLIPEGKKYYGFRSDVLRFIYLLENKNVLYLDSDIILERLTEIGEDDFVGGNMRKRDYYLMYRGLRDYTVFEEIFNIAIKKTLERKIVQRKWIYAVLQRKEFEIKKMMYGYHHWFNSKNKRDI